MMIITITRIRVIITIGRKNNDDNNNNSNDNKNSRNQYQNHKKKALLRITSIYLVLSITLQYLIWIILSYNSKDALSPIHFFISSLTSISSSRSSESSGNPASESASVWDISVTSMLRLMLSATSTRV